jgi:hypothetical protein
MEGRCGVVGVNINLVTHRKVGRTEKGKQGTVMAERVFFAFEHLKK